MTLIELIAVFFGLLCVWLTVRQHVACWPAGLVQVVLYVGVYWQARLYSEMLLHVVYIGLQLYGWWHWSRRGDELPLPVSRLSPAGVARWSAITAALTLALGGAMHRWTDAVLPYPDAFITAASLVATWWLCRKVLEAWPLWVLVGATAIGVYWHKALYPTMGLYAVFLTMAVWGWRTWLSAQRAPVTA